MNAKPSYRPDIDGLRAIAVLSVVLYHYGADWVAGGFSGVDIFFVISGFLITGILKREIESGEFSILGFYTRRIRRIFPALLAMLAVTLSAGWFVLMPGDYADLGESAVYAAFGLGNLFFYGNTGYFDQAADLQPLLHTWSLGVEEQFYFVWPALLLIGLTIVRSRRLFRALFALALIFSFAYAIRKLGNDPTGAFYLPHPRAWELAVGAIVAFLPTVRGRTAGEVIGGLGLALIGWSLFMLSSEQSFPGASALPACVGTALLLWPKDTTLISRTLSVRPLVAAGILSYSLYLWHWPVLVLFRHYIGGEMPSLSEAAALGILSLALAYLSWRFVEKPFRKPRRSQVKVVLVGLAAAVVVAAPAALVQSKEGFPGRIPPDLHALSSLEVMWQWDCEIQWFEPLQGETCVFGAPIASASSLGIIWGDSHAAHTAALMEPAARAANIAFGTIGSCPAALGGEVRRVWPENPDYAQQCERNRKSALAALVDPRVKTLVVAASWNPLAKVVSSETLSGTGTELVTQGLRELLGEIDRSDLRVVVVDQVPAFQIDPANCAIAASSSLLRRQCSDLDESTYEFSMQVQYGRFPGFDALAVDFRNVVIVHPRIAMCVDGRCLTEIDGVPLFRDINHLRRNLPLEIRAKLSDLIGLSPAIAPHQPIASAW